MAHLLQTELRRALGRPAVAVGVGVRGDGDAGHQRLIAQAVDGLGGSQRHRAHGAPVEGALEDDDARFARGVAGQLDRGFDRFRAAVGEKERIKPCGHDSAQFLGQLQHGLVVEDVGLAVDEPAALLLRGLDHAWVAVPGVGYRNAAGKVRVAPAADVVQVDALGVVHQNIRVVRPNGGKGRSPGKISSCHGDLLVTAKKTSTYRSRFTSLRFTNVKT